MVGEWSSRGSPGGDNGRARTPRMSFGDGFRPRGRVGVEEEEEEQEEEQDDEEMKNRG